MSISLNRPSQLSTFLYTPLTFVQVQLVTQKGIQPLSVFSRKDGKVHVMLDKQSVNSLNAFIHSLIYSFKDLFIHQVNLRNNNRQKYAVLNEVDCRLEVTALIAWSHCGQVTLEFTDGRYRLRTCNEKYLHRDGTLSDELSEDTAFTLELKSGWNLHKLNVKFSFKNRIVLTYIFNYCTLFNKYSTVSITGIRIGKAKSKHNLSSNLGNCRITDIYWSYSSLVHSGWTRPVG